MNKNSLIFLKKPLNSLTYRELIIQSIVGSVLGIVIGIFYAIIGSYLIGYGFNVLFTSVMIISLLYLIFFTFKPVFERLDLILILVKIMYITKQKHFSFYLVEYYSLFL